MITARSTGAVRCRETGFTARGDVVTSLARCNEVDFADRGRFSAWFPEDTEGRDIVLLDTDMQISSLLLMLS